MLAVFNDAGRAYPPLSKHFGITEVRDGQGHIERRGEVHARSLGKRAPRTFNVHERCRWRWH